jgi:hypothetical protein
MALMSASAAAANFNAIQLLNQSEFRDLSEDIAAAASYRGMIPAVGLGLTGFDVGGSVALTSISHRDTLKKAANGASVPSSIPVVAARADKGLPFGIDIGAVIEALPGTNLRSTGGELRWAFIDGGLAYPAVALRLATMNLTGVDQLKMRSNSVELLLSKRLLNINPYGGVGRVQVTARAPGTTLADEKFGLNKVFAGVNIGFVPLALLIEADRTGKASTVGIRFGARW